MKRKGLLIIALLMAMIISMPVFAVPYNTFTRSGDSYVLTQTAYEPYLVISHIGEYTLSSPSDLRIGSDGLLYIADTGNQRILVATPSGEWVRTIGEGILQTPRGVFRADNGLVYVADQDAAKVFVFDESGALVREIGRPDHPLFGATAGFAPLKVVVDQRGNVYITSQGNTNGIIQLAADTAEFLGYFGANITNVTWFTALRRMIYNEEQMVRLSGINPITVSNMAIDSRGLIYSVSLGDDIGLKKLNVAGRDILDIPPQWNWNQFIAVAVGENGNIFAASRQWIFEYTSEGEILFAFGVSGLSPQQRIGHFHAISAISIYEASLFVLDEMLNNITVLAPTEFTNDVHRAFVLFNDGQYAESMGYWTNIMQMNSMFSYAGIGLGEAHFRNGDFNMALQAFRRGFYRQGYSDTFWELRSDWMRDHLATIIIWVFALLVAWNVIKQVDRRLVPVLQPLRFVRNKMGGGAIVFQMHFCI